MRLFSSKNRPPHMGSYPCELLARRSDMPDLAKVPPPTKLTFERPDDPRSVVNAMREYQAMLDAIRHGRTNTARAACPGDPALRAEHLKSLGYFADAAVVGTCLLPTAAVLDAPHCNPALPPLVEALQTRQTKTLAAGIDMIMADLKDSINAPLAAIDGHTHAIVFLYENLRAPEAGEAGTDWMRDAQDYRAGLLAAETAVVLAEYIRLLGYDARAHTGADADVDLNRLAVAAGLATVEDGVLSHPYIGTRFGLSAVTTTFEVTPDQSLAPMARQPSSAFGMKWRIGG